MQLFDMKLTRKELLDEADKVLSLAESNGRGLSATESQQVDALTKRVQTLNGQIQVIESKNTLRAQFPTGQVIPGNPNGEGRPFGKQQTVHLSAEYGQAFCDYLQSAGQKISATLYESGGNSSGGFLVPSIVDGSVVPLAVSEMAVRRLSTVIETSSDIKFPTKKAFGTAALKSETASFGGTQMTIDQFTLTANIIGSQVDASWELLQDYPAFQQTELQDQIASLQMLEESYFVTGTGTGQPQGLIGNVGIGVTGEEPDTNGNLVSIDGTLDLVGSLNEVYAANATWLMSRATSIVIRKAQTGANLFQAAWSRENEVDYLHGFPVAYSQSMPSATRGNTPVLFGDFKSGYLIGDRGTSGISIKILDQPKAAQGLVTLLCYRRTDGRVRLAEAVKSYTIAAS